MNRDLVRVVTPAHISHQNPLCPRHNAPAANAVVSVASEQGLSITTPGQANALGLPALLANFHVFGLELVNLALLLKIENDNAGGSGGAQPVAVGREDESVDLIASGEGVEVL